MDAEKRREILNDYAKCGNYSEVARKHSICRQTVKRMIEKGQGRNDDDISYDVMEHLKDNSRTVCELIDKYLAVISDPARIENAPLNQVASTLGVLIDKFSKGTSKEKGSTDLERVLEAVRDIE